MSALKNVIDALRRRYRDPSMPYLVPSLWTDPKSTTTQAVNPYVYYREQLESILAARPIPRVQGEPGGEWTCRALVYNLFPRVMTAFDHDSDRIVRTTPRPDGWRETGTLLKATALLPYLQRMGFNTVHLLPITAVGQDGKKGTLGSPYAIRNPYQLDENLAEPALGLSVDDLFAAFVEAAHRLGLRVVMEFVLRTGARDSDWIKEHPEWFYWIRADVPDRAPGSHDERAFGAPIFDGGALQTIQDRVRAGDFHDLPAPSPAYRALYTPPPRSEQVFQENGRWFATLDDGTRIRVPGAFSDFPPDDPQPPWTDVTFLRMYDHPDFNYMAYNTIRMYDERLAQPENANLPLWDALVGVIPHYQQHFGIDGVMIDMGHALPMPLKQRIVAEARRIDPDFAFWEENFNIAAQSRLEGYNAAVGYFLFDLHVPERLRAFFNRLAHEPVPVPFFATAENHNTPRAAAQANGQFAYPYYTLPLCIAGPGIPYVHNGFELRETQPVNTGLNFTPEMLARYPAEKLPLFSEWAFNWTHRDNLVEGITYALALRRKYEALLAANDPATWHIGWSDNPHLLVFTRCNEHQSLTFIANTDMSSNQAGRATISGREYRAQGLWGTADALPVSHDLSLYVDLSPGYVLILEADDLPVAGC